MAHLSGSQRSHTVEFYPFEMERMMSRFEQAWTTTSRRAASTRFC